MKINKKDFINYISKHIVNDEKFFTKKTNAVNLMKNFNLPFHKNFIYSIKKDGDKIFFTIKYKTRIKDSFIKKDIAFRKIIEYSKKDVFLEECGSSDNFFDLKDYLSFYKIFSNYLSFEKRINLMVQNKTVMVLNKKTEKMHNAEFKEYICSFFGKEYELPIGVVLQNGSNGIMYGNRKLTEITITNSLLNFEKRINLDIMEYFPENIDNESLNRFEKNILSNKEIVRRTLFKIKKEIDSDIEYRVKMLKNKTRSENIEIKNNSVNFNFSSSRQMKNFLDSLKNFRA